MSQVERADLLVEDERTSDVDTTTAVKDPVCGRDIETATAAGRTEYKGQMYYFCGPSGEYAR
jgi:hypothetical protein